MWPPPLILLARLVLGLLFFMYLFHDNVRVYFRCANIRLWIVGISLVIAILAVHGLWIGIQFMVSIGVNSGVFPTKGLTLPLVSYGGNSLIVNCIVIALLLRIDYENRMIQLGLRDG